jgi:hypothetical protein
MESARRYLRCSCPAETLYNRAVFTFHNWLPFRIVQNHCGISANFSILQTVSGGVYILENSLFLT